MPVRFAGIARSRSGFLRSSRRCSPLVEPLSLDEAFLDVTGSQRLLGEPEQIARRIKEDVRSTTGLTASVGLSGNKFLAKLASDLQKPDGLCVIRPEEAEAKLAPLSVTRLWGVGPKTAARLAGIGIKTIGDLRKLSPGLWRRESAQTKPSTIGDSRPGWTIGRSSLIAKPRASGRNRRLGRMFQIHSSFATCCWNKPSKSAGAAQAPAAGAGGGGEDSLRRISDDHPAHHACRTPRTKPHRSGMPPAIYLTRGRKPPFARFD